MKLTVLAVVALIAPTAPAFAEWNSSNQRIVVADGAAVMLSRQ
jgi:hypothetical protein